jgi:hypothetical protein
MIPDRSLASLPVNLIQLRYCVYRRQFSANDLVRGKPEPSTKPKNCSDMPSRRGERLSCSTALLGGEVSDAGSMYGYLALVRHLDNFDGVLTAQRQGLQMGRADEKYLYLFKQGWQTTRNQRQNPLR